VGSSAAVFSSSSLNWANFSAIAVDDRYAYFIGGGSPNAIQRVPK
jgi:hypothetical protein